MDEKFVVGSFDNPEQAEELMETVEKFRRIFEDHEEVLIGPKDIEIGLAFIHSMGKDEAMKTQMEFTDAIFG